MTRLRFILIDHDRRRAAAVASALSRHGRGVTVTESFDAELGRAGDRTILLVADEGNAVAEAIERLKQVPSAAQVIAFAADPSSHQIVKAMAAGAADYLHWPCEAAAIVAAADAVSAAID